MLDQQNFSSFVMGDWIAPCNPSRAVCSAITGQELGSVGGIWIYLACVITLKPMVDRASEN